MAKNVLPDWYRQILTRVFAGTDPGAKRHLDVLSQHKGYLRKALKAGDPDSAYKSARYAAHRVRMLERHHSR
jgi:hypothetical protein